MNPVQRLVAFSYDHPRAVLAAVLLATALLLPGFSRIRIDTDPETMLEPGQPDRVVYGEVKRDFGLHDVIVAGIEDPKGIYRPEALERISRAVTDIAGIDGVISEDVVSLVTTHDATFRDGQVEIQPVMSHVPTTPEDLGRLRRTVAENRFLNEKIVSADGRAAAIYIPIQAKDQSARIASEVRGILGRGRLPGQSIHLAGLPVAEDTFGREMFLQMAVVAPLAFLGILALVFLLFRDASFLLPVGLTAALSVTWAMGALVGTGQTVHIMSSMIAVFLMPIAILDTIHILSDLGERRRAGEEMRGSLLSVMRDLLRPMLFTSVTTMVGFASLAMAAIPPVRVFGLFVAFGVAVAWLLTHTLVPATLALAGDRAPRGRRAGSGTPAGSALDPLLRWAGNTGFGHAGWTIAWSGALLLLGVLGIQRIRVDDNPVRWFRPGHPLRVSDAAMNRLFGGTYMANLIVQGDGPGAINRPDVIRAIEALQARIEEDPSTGKTSSVADVVKRLNLVLHEGAMEYYRVPDSEESIGQLLFIFQGSAQPGEILSLMDREERQANIWVQMREGDNRKMRRVEDAVAAFVRENPLPEGVRLRWSGLNHINMIWQQLMVRGMLGAVLGSFVVVLGLMILEFRSWAIGLLSMVPLSLAIVCSYGALGIIGKSYDMPIAVCSSLALGLSIDFAIHFMERFRSQWARSPSLEAANRFMTGAPGRAIARNAIVISFGFLPLLASSLTPYVTVSLFFAALMITSAVATLLLLPAALRVLGARVLP